MAKKLRDQATQVAEARVADLLEVLEVSRQLTAEPDLQPMLVEIEQAALRVLDCERASVFLHDLRGDHLYSLVATGTSSISFSAGLGIAGDVFRSNVLVNVSDAYTDPRFYPEIDRKSGFVTRNVLTCPLQGWDNMPVGVLQVLNKRDGPFTDWDEVLAQTLSAQAGVAVQRQLLLSERSRVLRIEHELDTARRIQQALLPKVTPKLPGFDVAGWNQAAEKTGGDFFDFQKRQGGNLAVTVADVSGHGIGPALVVAECRALLRATLEQTDEPRRVITQVNNLICENLPEDRFVTMFFGLLERAEHRMAYVSAGHGPTLFYSRAKGTFRELEVHGFPLGVVPGFQYAAAGHVDFQTGDLLAIVTDGFFEWTNPEGECYGIDRLQDQIQSDHDLSAREIIARLHQAVVDFSGETPQLDDLTAVVIKKL